MTVEWNDNDLRYWHRMGIKVQDHAATERRQRVSDIQPPANPNFRWWACWASAALAMWAVIYYGLGWATVKFLGWYWR